LGENIESDKISKLLLWMGQNEIDDEDSISSSDDEESIVVPCFK